MGVNDKKISLKMNSKDSVSIEKYITKMSKKTLHNN